MPEAITLIADSVEGGSSLLYGRSTRTEATFVGAVGSIEDRAAER
jgi:hypothetical protein